MYSINIDVLMKGPKGGGKAEDNGTLWYIERFSYDPEMKTREQNRNNKLNERIGNKAIWLVYRTDSNARGFCLVNRTLGWKNFMPE